MLTKKKLFIFLISIVFVFIFAITFIGTNRLMILGSWKGANVSQNGNSVITDWSKVKFNFSISGKYTYINPAEYSEQGKFKIKDNMLITFPGSFSNGEQRSVEIIQLRLNSLILRMNDGGNEIILQLKRS